MTITLSVPRFSSHAPLFGRITLEQARDFRIENGIPVRVHAAYRGYTGRKDYSFPITPLLRKSQYHDVTSEVETLKAEMLADLQDAMRGRGVLGLLTAFRLLTRNFPTAEPWDTKFLPQFPGRDKAGRTQYALYKGRVVSANYISNNIYGQVLAALGIPLWFAKAAAKMDACGIAELLFQWRLPERDLWAFRDTPEDQDAIVSGYHDHQFGDPWKNPDIDPARPYPQGLTSAGEDDNLEPAFELSA